MVMATNKLPRDTPFDVYFSDRQAVRTLPQNRYLWGVVYKTLSDYLGLDAEEIHEICKVKCGLTTAYDLQEQGIVEITKSTKMMDTREMTEYIDKIRRWSLDKFNIYIPVPGDLTDEHLIESKHFIP